MKRGMVDFMIETNNYLPGGTKEACVKVREFLHYATSNEDTVRSSCSSVEADEFVEAVKVLMASAFRKEDEIPETWRCNEDCSKLTKGIFCLGEFNLDEQTNTECPFFSDEGYI